MEENMLKQKYNELLNRYNNGAKYLMEHPENAEKINRELNKIEAELSKIIIALPDMTEEEKLNGFELSEQASEEVSEQVNVQGAKVKENAPKNKQDASVHLTVKQDPTPTTNLSTFKDNWNIATQLAKSDIIPDNYKNKPQNVVIAIRYRKPNEFRSIYSNAKYGFYQRENSMVRKFL